jgi:3-oxoacyl-[acyl-carrier protein] reductase
MLLMPIDNLGRSINGHALKGGGMDLGLAGRPALVAAASRGLGYACARSLAAEGAKIGICSRDRRAIQAARDRLIDETGTEVAAVAADVSTSEGAARFVAEASEALGGCHILVTNAGGPPPGPIESKSDPELQSALELNFFSAVRMAREALPGMRAAGYGRIVAITSLVVKERTEGLGISMTARLATTGYLKSLAWEVAPEGITVNAVLPGRILTDRIRELSSDRARAEGITLEEAIEAEARALPVRRLGDPQDVGDLVAFLASERAGYVTGCMIQVDGGRYAGVF